MYNTGQCGITRAKHAAEPPAHQQLADPPEPHAALKCYASLTMAGRLARLRNSGAVLRTVTLRVTLKRGALQSVLTAWCYLHLAAKEDANVGSVRQRAGQQQFLGIIRFEYPHCFQDIHHCCYVFHGYSNTHSAVLFCNHVARMCRLVRPRKELSERFCLYPFLSFVCV